MLHALNDIASAKNNKTTLAATKYFLNYAACNPDASIIYRASDMILRVDSDAAYLVCPEANTKEKQPPSVLIEKVTNSF
eukprot:jgi/Psemu1/55884/gm1.55884_g